MAELSSSFRLISAILYILFTLIKLSQTASCDTLPLVENALPTNNSPPYSVGFGLKYECKAHYTASEGTAIAFCEDHSNGTASFTKPSLICEHVGCEELPNAGNNFIKPVIPSGTSLYPLGTNIRYECQRGYVKQGGTTVAVCVLPSRNGPAHWDMPTLACIGINCRDPGDSDNAIKKGMDYSFPNNVTYACDKGYKMIGNRPTLFCMPTGTWSANVPECEIVTCPTLPNFPNGSIKYSESDKSYRSIAEYNCNDKFKLSNSENERRCTAEGTWSGVEPSCTQVFCDRHLSLENGIVVFHAPETHVGSLVILQCNPPDTTRRTLKCREDGTWDPPAPICSAPVPTRGKIETTTLRPETTPTTENIHPAIPCNKPEPIENGYLLDNASTNQTVSFGCKDGFKATGSLTITCLPSGAWSAEPPKCFKAFSKEIIIGIVVGSVIVVILLVVGVILFLKKKAKNRIVQNSADKKAQMRDAKHVDEIRYLGANQKPIPVTSL